MGRSNSELQAVEDLHFQTTEGLGELHYPRQCLSARGASVLTGDAHIVFGQATVLLTANVGLLAIQSVDTGKADRSLAQISSYISTFLSLGNIILCTILARQHRLDAHMTAQAAVRLARRCDIRTTTDHRTPLTVRVPRAEVMHQVGHGDSGGDIQLT